MNITVIHMDHNKDTKRCGYLIYTGTLTEVNPVKSAKRLFTKNGYTTAKEIKEVILPDTVIEGSMTEPEFDKIVIIPMLRDIISEYSQLSDNIRVVSHSKYFNRVIKEYFTNWIESGFRLTTGDDVPEANVFRYLFSDKCKHHITFVPANDRLLGDNIAGVFSAAPVLGTYTREMFGKDYRKSRLYVSPILSLPYIIHDKVNNKPGVYFTSGCKDVTLIGRNAPSILYATIITDINEDIDRVIKACNDLLDAPVTCIHYRDINTPDIRTLFKDHDPESLITRKGTDLVRVKDKIMANAVVPMNMAPKALNIFNALYLLKDMEGDDITDTFYNEGKFRNELRGTGPTVKYRGLTGRIKQHVWGRDIPDINTFGSLTGKNATVQQTYMEADNAKRPVLIIRSDVGTAIYSSYYYNIVRNPD